MQTTDAQVRKLMKEYKKTGKIGESALRLAMSHNTASNYLKSGKLPPGLKKPRTWRTWPDVFEEDGPALTQYLKKTPELEAKALFEHLLLRRLLKSFHLPLGKTLVTLDFSRLSGPRSDES